MPDRNQATRIGACDTDLDALLRRGRQLQAEAMHAFVTGLARSTLCKLRRLAAAPGALKRPSAP